jgi:IS30 family transposase
MSSNFTVNRICEQCGKVFAARTTVTRFCSKVCNSKNGKMRSRKLKMAPMDQVVKKVLEKREEDVSSAEFLNVKNAAKLLKASEKMVYHLINVGRLHAINLSERKTLVRRKEVDRLFELPPVFELKEINMGEAQRIFNISEKALFDIIKRNNLFKFQESKFIYVAKSDLNKIFNPEL